MSMIHNILFWCIFISVYISGTDELVQYNFLTSEVYRLGDNEVYIDRDTRSAIVGAEGRARVPPRPCLNTPLFVEVFQQQISVGCWTTLPLHNIQPCSADSSHLREV